MMDYRKVVAALAVAGGLTCLSVGTVSAATYQKTLPKSYHGYWFAYGGRLTVKKHKGYLINVYQFGGSRIITQSRYARKFSFSGSHEMMDVFVPVKYQRVVNPKTKRVSYYANETVTGEKVHLYHAQVNVRGLKVPALIEKTGKLKVTMFRQPIQTHSVQKAVQTAFQ